MEDIKNIIVKRFFYILSVGIIQLLRAKVLKKIMLIGKIKQN